MLEGGILECAYLNRETEKAVHTKTLEGDHRNLRDGIKCNCPGWTKYDSMNSALMNCKYLRFQSASMQETAYGMFVDTARRSLHRLAALYLESGAHKCRACGGGDFDPTLHKEDADKGKTSQKKNNVSRKRRGTVMQARVDKTFRTDRAAGTSTRSSVDGPSDRQDRRMSTSQRRKSGEPDFATIESRRNSLFGNG